MVSLFSPHRHPAAGSITHAVYVAVLPLLLVTILAACDSTKLDTPTDTSPPSLTLQLSTSLLDLAEGDAARLEVLQSGGASQIVLRNKVAWSTADPAIAAVDGNGMVLAKSAGETTVQAKTTVGTASARVRVGKGGNKLVSISPRASTLNAVGDTVRLAATVAGGSAVQKPSFAWSSLDPSVAIVSAHGTVTAKAPGIARITATAAQGVDTASVAVGSAAAAQVITVSVTPSTITVASGDSVRMAATAKDGKGALLAGTAFTWSSSNNTVVTVSASGVVKSLTEGSATITATVVGIGISSAEWASSAPAAVMGGGKSGSGQIKVNGKSQNKVTVSPEADTLTIIGDTTQLTATVLDSQGNVISDASVTWTSLSTGVATVDTKGKVISTGVGLALITAAYGSSVDTASIHSEGASSEPVVASVVVSPETASVTVGATVHLTATVKDASGNTLSGQTVAWSSSDPAAATVSSSGVVTGVTGGAAIITATSGGKIGTGAVSINLAAQPVACSGYANKRLVKVSTTAQLKDALWTAQPGDLIQLADGFYTSTFNITRSGTADAPIVLCGSRGAILRPEIYASGKNGILLERASHWILDGFTVTNSSTGIALIWSNRNVLRRLEVHHVNTGIHPYKFSSHNVIEGNYIHDTGVSKPEYGEAIYIGSWNGDWATKTDGQPDASDSTQVLNNVIGPNVTSEGIDVKEGTTGGVIRNNVFDGRGMIMSQSWVNSWVELKGNGYLVEGNRGTQSVQHGFDVGYMLAGWGNNNVFRNNTADVQASGYGFIIDTRVQGTIVSCTNTVSNAGSGFANVRCAP